MEGEKGICGEGMGEGGCGMWRGNRGGVCVCGGGIGEGCVCVEGEWGGVCVCVEGE